MNNFWIKLCFINYTLFANEKRNIDTITLAACSRCIQDVVSYPVGSGYEIIQDLEWWGEGGYASRFKV